jgi:16S rRNA (cytidine1402-2'-O)-methyltransferase
VVPGRSVFVRGIRRLTLEAIVDSKPRTPEASELPAGLYVVSTPIGNLADISLRAIDVLKHVATILAEDTRHSRRLLERYEIPTPVESYHEHNEARMTPRVLTRLTAGDAIALISDAGTPLVSDPGERLVSAVADAGFPIVPIPGASALLSALVVAGLPTERFVFYGFLPRKGSERSELLEELSGTPHTAVLYEAPGRVADTLEDIAARGGSARRAVVARELTKQYEEIRRGTVRELALYYTNSPPRGEVVIVLAGTPRSAPSEEHLRGRSQFARDVAATLVREEGAPRNLAYRLAQEP